MSQFSGAGPLSRGGMISRGGVLSKGGLLSLGTGGVSYDADAVALFARMAAAGEEPSAARKLLYNTAIVDWKASGFWADCRGLYVMASHGPISGRMNWRATPTT